MSGCCRTLPEKIKRRIEMIEEQTNSRPPSAQLEETYSDWARQLVEGLVEAESRWLELAAAQNELVFNLIRQGANAFRNAPSAGLGEWSRQGLDNFMEFQHSLMGNFDTQ